MNIEEEFYVEIIILWDELTNILAEPISLDSKNNYLIRKSTDLAISLNHFTEKKNIRNLLKQSYNQVTDMINDVCDMKKHGELRNKKRENKLESISIFEVNENEQFSFHRNSILVNHTSFGQHDLIEVMQKYIFNIITELKLNILWEPVINTAEADFKTTATLYKENSFNANQNSVRLLFIKLNERKEFIPFEPKNINFHILERK
ncbi:hypothetical protein [Leptospira limi]|uniref:Uncharacterized protein n=1 Tax=Leptospira limi TaxID=2950023 RepID=A0ABT3LZG5_9LEPT|nr:hypothetical protein [Leptospira limi]MCW7463124.1 hypothetical protein [Leptospira limi]